MSIFNEKVVEESGDWAIEQLYNMSNVPCSVCHGPSCLMRKSDGHPFYTVYNLFDQYKHACQRVDYLEHKIVAATAKVRGETEPNYSTHNRPAFIRFVRENCPDESKVLYKNNYYYSIDWFKKEFTYDIFKHYFEI